MSRTEHHKGRLTEVPLVNDSIKETCLAIIEKAGKLSYLAEMYTAEELIRDEFYDEYMVLNGKLYSIDSKEYDENTDIAEAKLHDDGTIDFEVRFYNGGSSMGEMIERAVEKAKIKAQHNV